MRHIVVGAGPIGSGVARMLAERAHEVVVVTRSGSGPREPKGAAPPGLRSEARREGGALKAPGGERADTGPDEAGIERVAADAADGAAIARLADGAAAIFNCANPPYHKWPAMWPPIAKSLLGAAERSGAALVTISNLYGYGPARASLGVAGYDAAHPMSEATPLAATGKKGKVRAQMWREALAAHEAGRVKAVEIRASDYVGPGANAVLGDRVVPRVLRGQSVSMIGRADRLHTWSYTEDVVAMAVLAGTDSRAWGRAWHVPSTEPRTQRQAVGDIARAAGVKPVPVRTVPGAVLYGLGVVSPLMRELRETEYQFSEDFVMDSTAARQAFGLDPTPWDCVLAAVLSSYGKPGSD